MPAGSPGDLTGRARLRDAAMRLFAEQGFDATSTRAVAAAAGMSPALITHHFGSKDGLRAAVDAEVLDRLGGAVASIAADEDRVSALGRITAEIFGADPLTRGYLRRLLIEGGPAGAAVFDRLLAGARRELSQLAAARVGAGADAASDGGREGIDPEWAPFQVLCLILGPLLLEPVMQPNLDRPLFDPEVLAARSAANQALVRAGLPGADGTGRRS